MIGAGVRARTARDQSPGWANTGLHGHGSISFCTPHILNDIFTSRQQSDGQSRVLVRCCHSSSTRTSRSACPYGQ
jgi:hypothetical protein